MKTTIKYRIFILASIIFYIGDLNAVPADYEAVYSVKLMQADGTLRAKLENNNGTYTYTLKTEPTGFWKLIAKVSKYYQALLMQQFHLQTKHNLLY